MRREWVHGLHPVEALLRHHPERVIRLAVAAGRRDGRLERILALADTAGIAVERLERRRLEQRLGAAVHQGVAAEIRVMPPGDERALEAHLERLEAPPLLVALDGVQDPRNLGACLRSADAAGAQGLILPKDRAVRLTPAARKAASGAAEVLPLFVVTNLARTLGRLRRRGLWVHGLDPAGPSLLYEADLTGPLCLVLGAEGRGMRRLTREACDALHRLPMQGHVESLNVSAATAVALFEALRQRLGAG
ncbi:MAG: 23S rRNA (guanosine(2251)-2'-O)-methyltransferase RlmB [Gammaproteobacteria bacterium]|nr:MAG: 23S rRNA (guanosine(2251)-2'-O)-methyltransferase RlmB [Gammaproteobacteria bacterium]